MRVCQERISGERLLHPQVGRHQTQRPCQPAQPRPQRREKEHQASLTHVVAEAGGQRVERQQHRRAAQHPRRVVDHDEWQTRPARHVPQQQVEQKDVGPAMQFGRKGQVK